MSTSESTAPSSAELVDTARSYMGALTAVTAHRASGGSPDPMVVPNARHHFEQQLFTRMRNRVPIPAIGAPIAGMTSHPVYTGMGPGTPREVREVRRGTVVAYLGSGFRVSGGDGWPDFWLGEEAWFRAVLNDRPGIDSGVLTVVESA